MSGTSPEFDVWRGREAQVIYVPYQYKHIFAFEKFWNPDPVHYAFNKYWSASIYIATVYVILIHILQSYQLRKKPRLFRIPLALWNFSLVIFSGFATFRLSEEFFHTLSTRPLWHSVCLSVNPRSPAAFWACAFAISKVAELADTFFLVARKKPVIFLHWYHHAVVLIYTWNSACELTSSGRWFIIMNFFVHTVMYTYYSISACGKKIPRIFSMFVTILQTSQMLFGVTVSILVLYYKMNNYPCQQSMHNLASCFAIYASFAVLFIRYFYDAYMKPKPKAAQLTADSVGNEERKMINNIEKKEN